MTKEEKLNKRREYKLNNKEKIQKQNAEYYKRNKERINAVGANYYSRNKEKIKAKANPLRRIFNGMIRRCYNEKHKDYFWYGDGGIGVDFNSAEEFENIMGKSYWEHKFNNKTTTIDRIDGSKNYNGENCRWLTIQEQQRNKRNNILMTYQGKTQILADWSKELNISRTTLVSRLKRGWSDEQALSIATPVKKVVQY